MRTLQDRPGKSEPAPPFPGRDRLRRALAAAAGPAAIAAAVLVVLHGFAFGGKVSSQHPDVLAFWLPNYCFLGRSLAGGHIPAWNPFVMGGVPFAADPQSGWTYLPAMALFTAMPCDVAIRWLIVLQPLLAGVGLYAFLRSEGLGRSPATVGGLSFALMFGGSRLGLFLPFPGAFAWTAVTLAACSRLFRAGTTSSRLVWAGMTALSWGQVLAAHPAHGAIIGTAAVAVFFLAKASSNVRMGRWTHRDILGLAGILVPAMVAVNLAFLLPRLAYVPESSYSAGYRATPLEGLRGASWPLALATAPGGYLGAVALSLSFAGLWGRRKHLAIGFGLFGLAGYALGLQWVAERIGPAVEHVPVLSFYTHFPGRFGQALLLAIPVLAGLGAEAWAQAPSAAFRRALLVLPAGLWLAGPLPVGLAGGQVIYLAVAFGTAASVLWLTAARPRYLAVLPVVLAADLVTSGLVGQTDFAVAQARASRVDALGAPNWFSPLVEPNIEVAAYVRPDRSVRILQRAGQVRFLSVGDGEGRAVYLINQRPENWGIEANQRSMLFGIQDAQGYNPVQLGRYWRFVRAATTAAIPYNVAVLDPRRPAALDLLQVGYLVTDRNAPPEPGATPAARVDRWILWRRAVQPPRAAVVGSVVTVATPTAALTEVLRAGFDPATSAVVEQASGIGTIAPTAGAVSPAAYEPEGNQAARVRIDGSSGGLLVVRNAFGRHWTARVDGQPAVLFPADYLLQGVVVPPGRHVIELAYDDPWIGYGLLGSGLTLLALLGAAMFLDLRSRRAVG